MNSKNNHRASDDITPSSNPPPPDPRPNTELLNGASLTAWERKEERDRRRETPSRLPASPRVCTVPAGEPLESRLTADNEDSDV